MWPTSFAFYSSFFSAGPRMVSSAWSSGSEGAPMFLILAGLLVAGLAIYLVVALLRPERFE